MCKSAHSSVARLLKVEGAAQKERNTPWFWPIHPVCILVIAPFLPSWLYLNRGYTVWYNLTALVYVLTNIESIRRFVIVQGIGVCAGWYAAMVNDVISHGRFAHILYMNMPPSMKTAMVGESGDVFYTYNSLGYMAISHILDTFLHPGIAYLLYKGHIRAGGTVEEIFTWKILFSTYLLSRLWSLVHTIYHEEKIGAWYFGYDVYHLNDLDGWMVAYSAEAAAYLFVILYKIFFTRGDRTQYHTNEESREKKL